MNNKSKLDYVVNLHKKNTDYLGFIPKPYLSTGKLKIEAKDEIKRRNGGRSCDVADSFVLTFAGDGALASGQQSKWSSKMTVKPDLRWVV